MTAAAEPGAMKSFFKAEPLRVAVFAGKCLTDNL